MFQILICFCVKTATPCPWKKVTPSFLATPFSKSWGSVKPPFLKIWLEAQSLPLQKGRVSHSWGGGRHPSHAMLFFEKPQHQNRCPPLKNEAPHLENNPPSLPWKRETPFHEMIPRKSTVNNNLNSSWNPWKKCVKKFIFSKFAGLQAHRRQLYYQMNSFTGIFKMHFKPPMLLPCIDLSPPTIKFRPCGKPWKGGAHYGFTTPKIVYLPRTPSFCWGVQFLHRKYTKIWNI